MLRMMEMVKYITMDKCVDMYVEKLEVMDAIHASIASKEEVMSYSHYTNYLPYDLFIYESDVLRFIGRAYEHHSRTVFYNVLWIDKEHNKLEMDINQSYKMIIERFYDCTKPISKEQMMVEML